MTFLRAIASGDARRARAASLGTDQDKKWVDAQAALMNGLKGFDRALLRRFGREAISTDIELKQAISTLGSDPIMRFESADAKEGMDTAELAPSLRGIRLAAEPPIFLRLDHGRWKVDLAAMRDQPGHDPDSVAQFAAAARALQAAARNVQAGRYKTLEEAMQEAR